jgi:hypothetical protein
VLGLTEEELYARIRAGTLMAYRAHIGDHWEWRIDPADQTQQTPLQAVAIEAASEEV